MFLMCGVRVGCVGDRIPANGGRHQSKTDGSDHLASPRRSPISLCFVMLGVGGRMQGSVSSYGQGWVAVLGHLLSSVRLFGPARFRAR